DKNAALGLMETGGLVLAMVVQPASGAFSDHLRTRFGRRRPMIAVGAVGAIAALLLMAGAQAFAAVVAVYCLLQFSMNVAQGGYQGLLPDTVPGAQRGRASGWLGVATLSGQVAGAVAAGPLAPRVMCLVIAGMVAATAAATVFGITEQPLHAAVERMPGSAGSRLRGYFAELLVQRDFCWVVASRFLMFTSLAAVQRFAAYYISDTFHGNDVLFGINLGSPQTATSAMLAVVVLFGMAVTYPAVRLSDQVGRRSVLTGAALVGCAGCALFVIAGSVTEVVLFALPVAVAFGMIVSVDWAFMAELAPAARAGKFLGFSNIATAGAQAAAPAVLGPVIDAVNARTGSVGGAAGSAGYRVMFVFGAVCFLLGALVLRRVRTNRPAAAPQFALT
ncbi:MAG: MFS transporter, partial [Candidatus Dormibacteraeota bacterium]|nr:MFS transporter [Candidatus Dormibacteraeota bacterium]